MLRDDTCCTETSINTFFLICLKSDNCLTRRHTLISDAPYLDPHHGRSSELDDADRPPTERCRHQLAEPEATCGRTKAIGPGVFAQVAVPASVQAHGAGDHDRPGHRRRSLPWLHPGQTRRQERRYDYNLLLSSNTVTFSPSLIPLPQCFHPHVDDLEF